LFNLFADGPLVLLLDGLNELPTLARTDKVAEIKALFKALDAATPVFVSCRSDDYQGALDLGLDTLELQPLSPPRVRAVLRHWLGLSSPDGGQARAERLFWQLAGDETLAEVLETWIAAGADEDLFWNAKYIPWAEPNVYDQMSWRQRELWRRHVRDPRSLLRLAANPFMLTMLFWVWVDRSETLPRNRGDLFARFVDALLDREHLLLADDPQGRPRYTDEGERLLAGLAGLAWTLQGRRIAETGGGAGDLGVLTVVGRDETLAALGDEGLLKKALDATVT
jgi:predicted NACHT family NTPase